MLARRAYERYEEYVGPKDRLPFEIEDGIAKLIITEMLGLQIINREKEKIRS